MHKRSNGHRRKLVLGIVAAFAVSAGVAAIFAMRGGSRPREGQATRSIAVQPSSPHRRRSFRLVEHATGHLGAGVQDAAAVALGNRRMMLLGGLTSADTSTPDVLVATPSGDRAASRLSTAVHDTAAARLGRAVYLFGGGTSVNTQSAEIVRVPAAGGSTRVVGRLPEPSSDQAAAVVGGTAYIVGGYTGSRWLDTIVAWRPGSTARVVAHLPFPLRYAAVTAIRNRLVIAGGSLESGKASEAVFAYRPTHIGVRRVGRLPAPTTHAAGATLGDVVYVIGGRAGGVDTQTARIVAIGPRGNHVHSAGALSAPRSDVAAVTLGDRILLAGGRDPAGTTAGLSELVFATAAAKRASHTTTRDVYANDGPNMLTGAARFAKSLVYVPNSESGSVDVIDPRTYRIVHHFAVGALPQHVVPAWDLQTLYVTNDLGNSLTPIDPRNGKPGAPIPVDDPYNMYFTPDGRYAVVVAERLRRLDFRDAHDFRLHRSVSVPCEGVDHMDFTADERFLLASCEFSGQMVVVDVRRERVVRTINLPDGRSDMPQDVKLSPDGRIFYVADMHANGVWEIDARRFRIIRFLATGAGAHGLYPDRQAKLLFVTNRLEGSISVVSFRTRKLVAKWRIPGGSPDMGGVSADGKVLWLTGRYDAEVYAISTRTGHLLARIHVGAGPHGLCVWPQPGRYSLGHTGVMR
jgi:DNA-binding beta-propeller fold protein YncE